MVCIIGNIIIIEFSKISENPQKSFIATLDLTRKRWCTKIIMHRLNLALR